MTDSLARFERVTRRAHEITRRLARSEAPLHPFDVRNIHVAFPATVRRLFDDGHYADATLNAFKFIEKQVQRHGGLSATGYKLMSAAFMAKPPKVQLTPLKSQSDEDEQMGFGHLFTGGVLAIRNPRAHDDVSDDPDTCLDHLAFASMLLRRLEAGGFI